MKLHPTYNEKVASFTGALLRWAGRRVWDAPDPMTAFKRAKSYVPAAKMLWVLNKLKPEFKTDVKDAFRSTSSPSEGLE